MFVCEVAEICAPAIMSGPACQARKTSCEANLLDGLRSPTSMSACDYSIFDRDHHDDSDSFAAMKADPFADLERRQEAPWTARAARKLFIVVLGFLDAAANHLLRERLLHVHAIRVMAGVFLSEPQSVWLLHCMQMLTRARQG